MAIQAPGLEWRSGESMENPVTDQIAQESGDTQER
jgi:hypothetical protein